MSKTIIPIGCFLISLLVLTSCQPDNCPDDRIPLGVTPRQPMVVQGMGIFEVPIDLQFPTDCDMFPYRGTLSLDIETPNTIPQATLFFLLDSQRTSTWNNRGFTPQSGNQVATIYLEATGPLTPGTYDIRLIADFDDPAETTQATLRIEVLSQGLNVVLLQPVEAQVYADTTTKIPLKALVSDSQDGIDSVSYRINRQGWVSTAYNGAPEVMLDRLVAVPEEADTVNGTPQLRENHVITIRGRNTLGEIQLDSTHFVVPRNNAGPDMLTEIRWDGGGDGIHWHDPFNWEGNRLPTTRDFAIVNDGLTEQVVLASTGSVQDVYKVGAVDIHARVLIQNRATLQLERSSQESHIRGSVRFRNGNSANTVGPTIRFSNQSGNTPITLHLEDTLFLGTSRFDGGTPGIIHANGMVYDEEDVNQTVAQATLSAWVTLEFHDQVFHERPFIWQFEGDAETALINKGTWQMYENSGFRRDTSYTEEAVIRNEGTVSMDHYFSESQLQINGQFFFDNQGTWTHRDLTPNMRPSRIFLGTPAKSSMSFLGNFRTDGTIFVVRGKWEVNRQLTTNVLSIGGFFGGDFPTYVETSEDLPHINAIYIEDGTFALPRNDIRLGFVQLGRDGRLNTLKSFSEPGRNIYFDSLEYTGGLYITQENDTFRTPYLNFQGSGPERTIWVRGSNVWVIEPHPQGVHSRLDFGQGRRVAFRHNIYIESGAILDWTSGNIDNLNLTSTVSNDSLWIHPGGTFQIDSDIPMYWNPNLFIFNYGVLRKWGNAEVDIWGCQFRREGGREVIKNGSIDFEKSYTTRC